MSKKISDCYAFEFWRPIIEDVTAFGMLKDVGLLARGYQQS
jgi:hypothetical protein